MTRTYAAHRLDDLQESIIRSITRYGIEKGAVTLAQGFPDFDPPEEVIAAAEQALRQGMNQYAMTWGLLAPRPLGFNPPRKVGLTPIGESHYEKTLLTTDSLFMDGAKILPNVRLPLSADRIPPPKCARP